MEDKVNETLGRREIESRWTKFLKTQIKEGKKYSDEVQFERKLKYAKALCKSNHSQEIEWGIDLLLMFYPECILSARADHLYLIALGYTRLNRYDEALDFVGRCLKLKHHHDAMKLSKLIVYSQSEGISRGPYKKEYSTVDRKLKRVGSIFSGQFRKWKLYDETIEQPDKLSKQIHRTYFLTKQTSSVYESKLRFKAQLETLLKRNMSNACLLVYGTSLSLDFNWDSLRVCLQAPDTKIISLEFLQGNRNTGELISRSQLCAIGPVILIGSRFGFNVELHMRDQTGFENDKLLTDFTRLDERVAPLIVYVKMLASIKGINNPDESTLSDYAYTLMVIHYLQCGCYPPILPDSTGSKSTMRPESSNTVTLGQLLVGFFRYFTQEFDFDKDAINMREARRELRSSYGGGKSAWNNLPDLIHIQDFHGDENVAKSVCDPEIYKKIKVAFRDIYSKLVQFEIIPSLEVAKPDPMMM